VSAALTPFEAAPRLLEFACPVCGLGTAAERVQPCSRCQAEAEAVERLTAALGPAQVNTPRLRRPLGERPLHVEPVPIPVPEDGTIR
jgi:hypothetical protein